MARFIPFPSPANDDDFGQNLVMHALAQRSEVLKAALNNLVPGWRLVRSARGGSFVTLTVQGRESLEHALERIAATGIFRVPRVTMHAQGIGLLTQEAFATFFDLETPVYVGGTYRHEATLCFRYDVMRHRPELLQPFVDLPSSGRFMARLSPSSTLYAWARSRQAQENAYELKLLLDDIARPQGLLQPTEWDVAFTGYSFSSRIAAGECASMETDSRAETLFSLRFQRSDALRVITHLDGIGLLDRQSRNGGRFFSKTRPQSVIAELTHGEDASTLHLHAYALSQEPDTYYALASRAAKGRGRG